MEERGCGCGSGIAAIIIMVVAALVGVAWYHYQQSEAQLRAEAAAEREQFRRQALMQVEEDIRGAEAALEQEDAQTVLNTLHHAEDKLRIVLNAMNMSGDADAAMRLLSLKRAITDAVEAIEEAEGDREALQVARVLLKDIRRAFERHSAVPEESAEQSTSRPAPSRRQGTEDARSAERTMIRDRQLALVAHDVTEAAHRIDEGNVDDAMRYLRGAEEQLRIIRASASATGESADAERLQELHDSVGDAIASIDSAPEGQQRAEAAASAAADLQALMQQYEDSEFTAGQ